MPTLKNSSANNGMSNLLELNPPKSQLCKSSAISGASCSKVGSFATFSSVIPCIAVVSVGIGIVGLTSQVLLSLFPLGNIFRIDISTILSVATCTPVVSKSKKAIGFSNFKFIMSKYKKTSRKFEALNIIS